MAMSVEEKFELVKRNTIEILAEKDLKELLKKKKNPVMYLGTAITGKPHIGYYMWVLKLADFLKAGFKVKVLLADMHGALDNCPWEILEKRYKYYEKIIPLMFESLGVDTKQLEFVKGSSFQLKDNYAYDILRMSTCVTVRDCTKAASEVVKMGDNPKLSGLIYPIMQALDEEYLKVDMQFGATDQRKIFVLARENNPKIGYEARIEIMGPIIPGLIGKKMSASNEKSKIDLLDDEKSVAHKLKGADMVAGETDNGVMGFLKYVLMIIKKDNGKSFVIERPVKFGGDLTYLTYEELERDVVSKKIHPLDLKNAVAKEISVLLKPIEKHRKELEKLSKNAF